MDDIYFTLDRDGIVRTWSAGARAFTGLGERDAVGLPHTRLHADGATEGPPTPGTVHARYVSGNRHANVALEHTAVLLGEDGAVAGYFRRLQPLAESHHTPDAVALARYRTLFEHAPVGILYADAESNYLDANACICAMLGYTREELVGLHASDIVAGSEADHVGEALSEIHGEGEHRRTWIFRRKDGTTFDADVIATRFDDGTLLGMVRDVTELRRQEREINRMSRLYAALSQINQAIVWTREQDALFQKVCEVLVEFGGFQMAWLGWHDGESDQLVPAAQAGTHPALSPASLSPSEHGPAWRAYRSGESHIHNHLAPSSTEPWVAPLLENAVRSCAAFPIRSLDQVRGVIELHSGIPGFFGEREVALIEEAATDVSFALDNFAREQARQEAELLLREEKGFSDTMIESMPGILYFYDSEGRFLRWNKNFETVSGYSAAEIATMQPTDFFEPAAQPLLVERITEVFTRGESSVEAPFRSRDGSTTPYLFTGRRIYFHGRMCLVGVGIDISERVRAEDLLRESDERYRGLFHAVRDPLFVHDRGDQRILAVNDAACERYGYSRDEFLTMSLGDIQGKGEPLPASTATRGLSHHQSRDESAMLVELSTHELQFDGAPAIAVQARDVTEQRRLEDELRQSQKMEAVGQLAGGIAHDFNNLLTIIAGYSDLLITSGTLDGPDLEALEAIREAGERASTLTRQLLGFSRRTILEPRVLDLNAVITETAKMLTRLIGEDIALATVFGADLRHVLVDPGQLDQILMNMAVNARDAMPRGGSLTIETANVFLDEAYAATHLDCTPGPHVMLAISDTGCGMSKEVLARIFEPFFTTKGVGKGTGLGLAMVFGIVQQSGGCIHVYSEVDQGTSFRIYFPAIDAGDAGGGDPLEEATGRIGGTETILLVEDDAALRSFAARCLAAQGYRVLEGENGLDALEVASNYDGVIDLLLTDVVMPFMGGPALAGRILENHPGVRVLYASGYTDDAVVRHGLLEANVDFLQKPYTPQSIGRKVRQVLDGPPPGEV